MRRFILVALTAGLLSSFSGPLHAGLGEAEAPDRREFDAWCGKPRNKCKVVFTNDSLTVNGTDGISRSQMRAFSLRKELVDSSGNRHYHFDVSYEEGGTIKSGRFIFANADVGKEFKQTLYTFCPDCNRVYDPVDD